MIWEKYVYKFVLFSLSVGLLATVIRWILVLVSGIGDLVEYVGAPIAISLEAVLVYILWRNPRTLPFVLKTIYWFMTAGISVKLLVLLFFSEVEIYHQFVQISPWMYINYLIPFFIFRSRAAIIVSASVYGVWVVISVGFWVINTDRSEFSSVFIQTYVAQCILIVFVALYTRLQTFYFNAKNSVRHMERLASTDFLLGIANRRSMQIELTYQLVYAEENGTSLSVVLLDIDHFKQINDTYGHPEGDAVLIEVSSLLQRSLNGRGLLGRWGGEEFLVVLPHFNSGEAKECADKIRRDIEIYPFKIGHVTASFGVAEYQAGDKSEALLERADNALYKSKNLGRNRVEAG